MTIIYKFLAGVACIAIAGGCTGDFDPTVESTPVAVLNVVVQPDSVITASVTRSWRFAERKPDVVQRDAHVTVSINDGSDVFMTFDENTLRYVANVHAVSGDRVTVTARTAAYGEASGSTVIPDVVKIDSLSCTTALITDYNSIISDSEGWHYDRKIVFNYSLTFTDPADEENFYMLEGFDECNDVILGENDSPLDAVFSSGSDFYVFSDRSINGKTYTLSCSEKVSVRLLGYDDESLHISSNLRLYSISREYYLYLLSIYKKYNNVNSVLEDIGLAQSKELYSNVSPGTGIVAAQNSDVATFDMYDILLDYKHKLYPDE